MNTKSNIKVVKFFGNVVECLVENFKIFSKFTNQSIVFKV